jgi:TIR domain/Bacterial Ig-like domain (group 2)
MTDIFLSYANEDRDAAARLAAHLESIGWRVWWDRRIPAGRTWRAVLETALAEMRCMIVLWSKHSVESPWVAEEAEEARRLGKTLVPVLIERVEPPIGFRAIQAADLSHWGGSADDPTVQMLVTDLKSLLGAPREQPHERHEFMAPRSKDSWRTKWLTRHWPKLSVGGLVLLVVFALWQYGPLLKPDSGPAVTAVEEERAEVTPAPQLTSVSLHGSRQILKPAETLKLSATGKYSDGSESVVKDGIEWSSSDTRVAAVDEDGEVRALQSGTTHIVAKIGAVASSTWTLDVEAVKPTVNAAAPQLVGLKIISNKNEFSENEKIQLRTIGRYSDDSEKAVSREIIWKSSDRAVASVNDRGELQGLKPGSVEVVARTQNLASAPRTFMVKEAPGRVARQTKSPKTIPPPVQPAVLTEQARTKIAERLNRAQTYRELGNYPAALAELEQAKIIDSTNAEIREAIEQTKRACNAERALGNKLTC